MRIFWHQGGLQLQPDNEVEAEALLVLLDNVKYEGPPEYDGPRTPIEQASLGQVERGGDLRL